MIGFFKGILNSFLSIKEQTTNKNDHYEEEGESILPFDILTENEIKKLTAPQIKQCPKSKTYEEYIKEIKGFNPKKITTPIITNKPLTELEAWFLLTIGNKPIYGTTISQYWIYEYRIDFCYVVTRLISEGYLTICDDIYTILSLLKVVDLKEILRENKFKVSGRKDELIKRLIDNLPQEKLDYIKENFNTRYVLTEKGKEATMFIRRPINYSLYAKCMELILKNYFNDAYRLLCYNETTKLLPSGLGVNYENEFKKGLSVERITFYTDYMKNRLLPYANIDTVNLKYYKAAIILNRLTGLSCKKIASICTKITNMDLETMELVMRTESSRICSKRDIESYKALDITQYEYLATLDARTCEICGRLDGKIFDVDKAEYGVNLPPMHPYCRCTTVSHISKEIKQNWKRISINPKTGQTEYVPASMTYEDWRQSIIDQYGQAEWDFMEKSEKNWESDFYQWENFKIVLGKSAPKEFEDFQKIKYNDNLEWNNLTKLYEEKIYLNEEETT